MLTREQSNNDYAAGRWDYLSGVSEAGHYGATAAIMRRYRPILGIGCGAGNVAALLPHNAHYTGLDISDVAISHAQDRLPHFSFVAAAFAAWEPDVRYSCIAFENSMSYLGDSNAAMERASKWLTKDGVIVCAAYQEHLKFKGWRLLECFTVNNLGKAFWTVSLFKQEPA